MELFMITNVMMPGSCKDSAIEKLCFDLASCHWNKCSILIHSISFHRPYHLHNDRISFYFQFLCHNFQPLVFPEFDAYSIDQLISSAFLNPYKIGGRPPNAEPFWAHLLLTIRNPFIVSIRDDIPLHRTNHILAECAASVKSMVELIHPFQKHSHEVFSWFKFYTKYDKLNSDDQNTPKRKLLVTCFSYTNHFFER